MKTEIEARLLECNESEIIRKLEEHNAQFIGDWIQIRHCYDFNPVNPNSWIRLRTNGEETTLTIKEIQDSSINGTKEWEIVVSDFNIADEMLNKMGYQARSVQENRRIRYVLDDVEIDIDLWPKIPSYVEFESENVELIKKVCKKLGINYESLVTLDVMSIYEHYGIDLESISKICLEKDRKNKMFGIEQEKK